MRVGAGVVAVTGSVTTDSDHEGEQAEDRGNLNNSARGRARAGKVECLNAPAGHGA